MLRWPVINQLNTERLAFLKSGAGEESRTLDLNLGKVALYQLSYSRMEWYCTTTETSSKKLEREKSLELSTSTLARLRSTN
jgi:hypothetical protein